MSPSSGSATYVTVAIPYVNADPHLGYAYELVLADTYARHKRRSGAGVRFLGGTDDYSLKNVLAAAERGVPTDEYVRRAGERFAALREPLSLSFDDFINTSTDERHVPAVERLWRAVANAGQLYVKDYSGLYCVGCERFYGESELNDGLCPEHLTAPEAVSETNWFFRLSNYQDELLALIESDRIRIRPEEFRREVLAFVRDGLEDFSVSRTIGRAKGWGVPVPNDPGQVIYVWFDALSNYISALSFGDVDSPAFDRWWATSHQRVHVIGKGILRFHAVYWPAMLLAAEQELPTEIRVHPYLSVEGRKLSKSGGAQLDPAAIVEEFGVDALRWFFARDVNDVADTDFSRTRMVARANDELANSMGNGANRLATLVRKALGGRIPSGTALPSVAEKLSSAEQSLDHFDLRTASARIAAAADELNAHISATEPWRVARDPKRLTELTSLLGAQVETMRQIGEALTPIVPDYAQRLLAQLPRTGEMPPPQPIMRRLP